MNKFKREVEKYNKAIRLADQKFRRGDKITNSQLEMLLNLYAILQENLSLLGDLHRLSFLDVNNQYMRLKDMKMMRGQKNLAKFTKEK
jgi:hypothetical protein